MNYIIHKHYSVKKHVFLSCAVAAWICMPIGAADMSTITTKDVLVEANAAQEDAKYEAQQKTIITATDIQQKQAKSIEDIIFSETGVSRTVDAMGRVGVSIRGAEPRHTLILVDGQPVLGDLSKYAGAMDEVMRLGTENVERIEVIQGAASAKYGSDAIGGVINIITKKAAKDTSLQFNLEGSHKNGTAGFPYTNVFLRADTGNVGKFRFGLSGSKRDILPIYASKSRKKTGMSFDYSKRDFTPNALRYYGDAATVGFVSTYEANQNNTLNFRFDRYTEDLVRDVKHSDSDLEPQQHFKRRTGRNSYNVGWTGTKGHTDWNVEMNYSRIHEDDIALVNYYGRSSYEGTNELRYIDNIDHRQWDFKVFANTQLHDAHLLSYGFGTAYETGKGSRLKNSPNTKTKYIDPWDYDKSLLVDKLDRHVRKTGDNSVRVWSHVHDYKFKNNSSSGMPEWDMEYEYYGYDGTSNTLKPLVTYVEYVKYDRYFTSGISDYSPPDGVPTAIWEKYKKFRDILEQQNVGYNSSNIVRDYYQKGESSDKKQQELAPRFNGKHFLEEFRLRDQRITVGEGAIRKHNFFIQDTWQLNENTLLTPIIRLDHSSLFGANMSANLGLTHQVNSNPHRRFKANIGTSYAEPGMGELWYNWEMYASNPIGIGYARMGHYWVGNPHLKPEKSLNIDLSLEGENKNTYMRIGLFHNRITDYMTVYFTGKFMDFAPYLGGSQKYQRAPDLIYSFKNIGEAEITGLEAEIHQKFGTHWTGKLGYTWLHTINKSDSKMPRQLLNKPAHKVDISLSFADDISGWSGQLWGDYYIHMLDSNSLADNNNYWPDVLQHMGPAFEKQSYQKKTFGLWNMMLQKKLHKDALVYFGINNLFNHRDDDRATQERVYRFGINVKFGGAHKTKEIPKSTTSNAKPTVSPATAPNTATFSQKFLKRPFDTTQKEGISFIGDYRAAWTAHNGTNRPQSPYRATTTVGTAKKNMFDAAAHGFGQRLRLGIDARISKNTNIRILGSTSGTPHIDTIDTTTVHRGLGHQRLNTVDITQHANQWDFSIGRLTEPMGITGYWFGKEFDGGRAVWTGSTTQVRLGYGSFKHSTGISDSAYTHSIHTVFYRPPTVEEFLGINRTDHPYDIHAATQESNKTYEKWYKGKTDMLYFYQQFRDAVQNGASLAEQCAVLQRMHRVIKAAYGNDMAKKVFSLNISPKAFVLYKIKDTYGNIKLKKTEIRYSSYISKYATAEEKAFKTEMNKKFAVSLYDDAALKDGKAYLQQNAQRLENAYKEIAAYNAKDDWSEYANTDFSIGSHYTYTADKKGLQSHTDSSSAKEYTFAGVEAIITEGRYNPATSAQEIAKTDILKELYTANYIEKGQGNAEYGWRMPQLLFEYLDGMERVLRQSELENKQPREALAAIIGNLIKTEGTVLVQDTIPSLDTAAFIQVKQQLRPNFGISAWYLRSCHNKAYTLSFAHDTHNDTAIFTQLANIFGIGAKWQLGTHTYFDVDYGQNRTVLGRCMNGHSLYNHERGTADFKLLGRAMGGTPHFWVARLSIGQADLAVPGSWNAFADYKYFQHGSFFGGNGTGSLPDRYLDGIHSFTLGAGYVPRKNFLLEAFYTFDAKGIGKRDTLYGPENFQLGNYTKLQLTYKF